MYHLSVIVSPYGLVVFKLVTLVIRYSIEIFGHFSWCNIANGHHIKVYNIVTIIDVVKDQSPVSSNLCIRFRGMK